MTKKTYAILSRIPLLGAAIKASCQFPMCSPGLSDGVYAPIFEYARKHPEMQITRRLVNDILSGKTK